MSKHTPGPWDFFPENMPAGPSIIPLNGPAICDFFDKSCGNRTKEEHEANARLISAAPELLEALELIVSDDKVTGENYGERREVWIETARTAIQKAKGTK